MCCYSWTSCFLSTIVRSSFFFFFNDTATTEIYTLSLHDALPISSLRLTEPGGEEPEPQDQKYHAKGNPHDQDRKSTRLNSSHSQISYAVFCLKKKHDAELRHQTIEHERQIGTGMVRSRVPIVAPS